MAKIITKNEIAEVVAKQLDCSIACVKETLECVRKETLKQLKQGNTVKTIFGQMKVVAVKARVGRNPQTGEKIKIAACKRPKISISKDIKDLF